MKKTLLVLTGLMAIGMLFIADFAGAAERASMHEEVKLYPSPGHNDPYTLFYDIKVKSPGVVRVALQALRVSPEK